MSLPPACTRPTQGRARDDLLPRREAAPAPGWAVCPWWGVQGRPRKGPADNCPHPDIERPVCRP
ncbi:hypothetical protein CRV15_11160 [Streptomyces clavuligerus]|nr:hypothetical protein D1794_11730 [Streptomyces clavuligerus]QCS06130.1 hypothetical protein CRV15_11160 [Streptomyces clavuligerus]